MHTLEPEGKKSNKYSVTSNDLVRKLSAAILGEKVSLEMKRSPAVVQWGRSCVGQVGGGVHKYLF